MFLPNMGMTLGITNGVKKVPILGSGLTNQNSSRCGCQAAASFDFGLLDGAWDTQAEEVRQLGIRHAAGYHQNSAGPPWAAPAQGPNSCDTLPSLCLAFVGCRGLVEFEWWEGRRGYVGMFCRFLIALAVVQPKR